MSRLSAGLLTALAAAAPALAAAPAPNTTPPFPTVREDLAVMLWLRQNTSLRAGEAVVFGRDNVLVVASDERDGANPQVHRVTFRQEAIGIEFVARTGGRSVRGLADIDCSTRQVRAQSVALFTGSDLRGEQITTQGPDVAWRAPLPGTASAIVVGEVCAAPRSARPTAPAPAAPAPAPATIASLPPPRPPIRTTPAPAAPPPAPVVATAPIPAPPAVRTMPEATQLPPVRSAQAPAAPPAAPPPPAPRRPATPTATPRPPVATPPAPASAAAGAPMMAQIGAFSTRGQAEAAWSKATASFPEGFSGKTVRIEPTVVNGATVFRTYVQGLANEAAARAFCAQLTARSQACFIRRAP